MKKKMKIIWILSLAVALLLNQARSYGANTRSLTIYIMDVGSGTACLIVSPSGESMLIDTGIPEEAKRVLAVIKEAGVKQLDYMVVSHYHLDHYGGVPYLAQNILVSLTLSITGRALSMVKATIGGAKEDRLSSSRAMRKKVDCSSMTPTKRCSRWAIISW